LETDFDERHLPEGVAENVYRIVQECLTNTFKHARADEVAVSVRGSDGWLRVEVRDDGVGFDYGPADTDRLGLLGIRERVELLGGRFECRSRPNEGACISASIPLDRGGGGEGA
jgi:signal transduction histidine kinase